MVPLSGRKSDTEIGTVLPRASELRAGWHDGAPLPTAEASPQHGLHHRVQGDLDVQLVSTRELHVDGPVPGDDVARVVGTFYPDCVLVHDVSAIGLQSKGGQRALSLGGARGSHFKSMS